NVQARELQLGSGGFDVLYANLTRGLDLSADDGAHVMKLPYTPLQSAVRHVEEDRELPGTLAGMPVVCCSVHSQVAPVCAGIGAGIVGTGSSFGHGGVAAAEAANAASALGGSPIVAVRASEADARARHRGVSHHTRDVLALCLGDVSVAWPANRPVPDLLVAQ